MPNQETAPQTDTNQNIRRRTFSGHFKAAIVIELIQGKKSLKELAVQHQLHPNQIKNWKSILLRNADSVLDDKRRKARDG